MATWSSYRFLLGQKPRDPSARFLKKEKYFPWLPSTAPDALIGTYVSGVYRVS